MRIFETNDFLSPEWRKSKKIAMMRLFVFRRIYQIVTLFFQLNQKKTHKVTETNENVKHFKVKFKVFLLVCVSSYSFISAWTKQTAYSPKAILIHGWEILNKINKTNKKNCLEELFNECVYRVSTICLLIY